MFEVGKDYTREDIHTQCGGNKQAFLPVYKGKVVAESPTAAIDWAPYIQNSGFTVRQISRVIKLQRR